MAILSPVRAAVPLLEGLSLINHGKVCDTYDLGSGLLLAYRTDGISIFDFVLNALIPEKGMVLTALSHFWLKKLEKRGIKTHLVVAGALIDEHLPAHLRGNPQLQARSMVVRRLNICPVEFIIRACLTGFGLRDYLESGEVCGVKLSSGLQDGDVIGVDLFTPTTKSMTGHDQPLNSLGIQAQYPKETEVVSNVFGILKRHASEFGIVLADSKFELGYNGTNEIIVADEVGTPDSSRYWLLSEWEESRKQTVLKAPKPFDKQLVREWGIGECVDKFNPEDPVASAHVHKLIVPEDLIQKTTQTYRDILLRLTSNTLEGYFARLGVDLL